MGSDRSENQPDRLQAQLADAHQQISRLESALASMRHQLSEEDGRTRRLEEEFLAFRARRSVRVAVIVANAVHDTTRRWRRLKRRHPAEKNVSGADRPFSIFNRHPEPTAGMPDTQYGTETINITANVPEPSVTPAAGEMPLATPVRLKISAVLPCFNGTAYLEEALSSIRSQTRPVDEVIVVDDGSTDGSAELAERWGATVIRHGVNRGEGAARNTGWRAATGDAIAWLDADDSWRPNHVEVVAALLERHPDAACAFGAVQRFGLDDQLITGFVPVGEPCELLHEAFQSWLHASIGCIMRRAALEGVGGYEEEERTSVDFDLWLKLAHRYRFVATHEVTANWRWHEAQQSASALGQILAVHRYRRRFLKTLRANGEDALAEELEPLARPAWTAHLNGIQARAESRRRTSLECQGKPYRGPSRLDRWQWAALSHLHPSVIDLIWRIAH